MGRTAKEAGMSAVGRKRKADGAQEGGKRARKQVDEVETGVAENGGGGDEEKHETREVVVEENNADSPGPDEEVTTDEQEDEEPGKSGEEKETETKEEVSTKRKEKGAKAKARKVTKAKTTTKGASKRSTGNKTTTKRSKVTAKSKSASTSRKPAASKTAVKRRKARTMEERMVENAPMAHPFFVETGSEWNATNIDFDELATLRRMPELPMACHVLWLLQTPLTLRFSNRLLEYEAALLAPEGSPILEDVFTKLLLQKSERDCLTPGIGLKYEWWNKQLREHYMAMYDKWYALLRKAGEPVPKSLFDPSSSSSDSDSDDTADEHQDVELTDDEWLTLDILRTRLQSLGEECPLRFKAYHELSITLRCRLLANLCEAVMDDPANTDYVRQMEEDDLRVEPLGRDRVGNEYFFFPQFYEERRVYRLAAGTMEWDLWAKGDDAFRAMLAALRSIKGRKLAGEQDLIDHLEVLVEQIEDDAVHRAKMTERATRRAILEAIPRKRSLRLQVKQLEQMEKEKEEHIQHVLSQEERAEQKRQELLRKVERDAQREAREQQREAKRAEREQHEKEAAIAERELRRQRRMEREQEMAEQEKAIEEQRHEQEAKRRQRAKMRQLEVDGSPDEPEEASAVHETISGPPSPAPSPSDPQLALPH